MREELGNEICGFWLKYGIDSTMTVPQFAKKIINNLKTTQGILYERQKILDLLQTDQNNKDITDILEKIFIFMLRRDDIYEF